MAVIFSSLLADTILASVILVVMYVFVNYKFNYWQKRGVRCIRDWPIIGSLAGILLLRENLMMTLRKKHEQMAGEPYFGLYFFGVPTLVVRDLELVKNILVKDAHVFLDRSISSVEDANPLFAKALSGLTGNKWKHVRMKLSPTFTSGKMRRMFDLVDECGKQLTSCLLMEASSGSPVDVKETMYRFTTDTIASCAFGVEANSLVNPECEFRTVFKKMFVRDSFAKKIVNSLVFALPALANFFGLKIFDDEINNFVRRIFWDVVKERKKTGLVRNDFMDLLIKLKDEGEVSVEGTEDLQEVNQEKAFTNSEYSKKDNTDVKLDGDDYVAQAMIFMLAGLEGSAQTLTYTLYELALNPHIQKKLRNEITAVLGKFDGRMSYDAISDMSYLDMVISETLRKYSGSFFLERKCLSDYKIPGNDFTIEKGTSILISTYGIHYDPTFYPDPEKYDPERFSVENKTKRPKYAYLPFGEGPRNCIGMRFALMQVKTALVHLLTSHEVRTCAQTPRPPLKFKPDAMTLESQQLIVLELNSLA